MRLSRSAPLLLICVLALAILISKISDIITINYEPQAEQSEDMNSNSRNFDQNVVLGDAPNNLMWFIQVSDLHFSIFHDPQRISDFSSFCNTTIDAIRPAVVLASGDLADGKAVDNMGSDQYIQEWEHYQNVLDGSNVLDKTIWLDIRGNHDNFNVPGVFSRNSYYHQYSVQGKKHLHSYMYTVTKGTAKYSFIAVDACLEPGPRRPFNFIGSITDNQFNLLKKFELESRVSNATIWFGHYPTSCIISPNPGIRRLMKNGAAYMCGHLHTLGGLVPKMYTLQHSGILELELGDWKDNRLYRVAAFDHGLFTFADVQHNVWPVVLITNPKHALYSFEEREPLALIKQSTHVRILVFSPHSIEKVRVKFDNEKDWLECQNIEGSLHVAEWNPNQYYSGIHYVHVYARDTAGNFVEISQPFSLDGSKINFELLPRIVLMTDARKVFQLGFAVLVVLSVLPLIGLRVMHILVMQKRLERPSFQDVWHRKLLRKLWILSTINKLFVPLIIYPVYLVIGPWFIGEVIEGNIGVSFAWGTLINGKLLPGSFTYFYGAVQLFWFHLPFILVLSHCVDCRFKIIFPDIISPNSSHSSHFYDQIPCVLLLVVQAIFAYFFWQAYGGMAFILGPLRTWSVVMGIYLWYSSIRLGRNEFSEAHFIWRRPTYTSQNGRTSTSSEL